MLLAFAALWLAVVPFGIAVRDEDRKHNATMCNPGGNDGNDPNTHEMHILHAESNQTDTMADEEWFKNLQQNGKIVAKRYIKMGAKINVPLPQGVWVIGKQLSSKVNGVLAQVHDEALYPQEQWWLHEMFKFKVSKLAKYPMQAAWPWMDARGHQLLANLVQSEVQKLGPYPILDELRYWSTFGLPQLRQSSMCEGSCKFYYEVELLADVKEPQIGWATIEVNSTIVDGVGDDRNGWAADGERNIYWLAGNVETGQLSAMWREGDVVGLAVDIQKGLMKWSLNGYWNHGPEKNFDLDGRQLFPCLSMWGDFNMLIAANSWKFSPPEDDYMPWTSSDTFAGHEPQPADIRINTIKEDYRHVSVVGADAKHLGITGNYSLKWDGIGRREPYYVRDDEEKHDEKKLTGRLYIYHRELEE